jgi:hypothetical protein
MRQEEVQRAVDESKILSAYRHWSTADEDRLRFRLETGRLLCEARSTFPPRSGDWTVFLERLGIAQQRASEAMEAYRKSLLPDSGDSTAAHELPDELPDDPPDREEPDFAAVRRGSVPINPTTLNTTDFEGLVLLCRFAKQHGEYGQAISTLIKIVPALESEL